VISSKTCLLPLVSEQSRSLLRLHAHYKRNILPFAGGLMDQPQAYLQAMELLNGY